MKPWAWFGLFILCCMFWPLFFILPIVWVIYLIWEFFYFRSEDFLKIKNSLVKFVDDCNKMNDHIEKLKDTYEDFEQVDYGTATIQNISSFNYKKKGFQDRERSPRVVECSRTVVANAERQPIKYFLKYFNIEINDESLAKFEKTLNDFSAAEQGVNMLLDRRAKLLAKLKDSVPKFISKFRKAKLEKKLGFEPVDISTRFIPTYIFRYVSSGGNAGTQVPFYLELSNLESLVNYLGEKIKFRKSAAGQRALMTRALREKIKERDQYACKKCKNSLKREPNLLLEIDHILPVSKGGLTTESNLQTLCWRCNRTKGAKIEN